MSEKYRKDINWELVDLYLKSGASQKKIADNLQIHPNTLSDRVKEKYGVSYSTYSMSLCSEGELLLEAAQFQKALKSSSPGNTQMLIWLGKVRLGQREPDMITNKAPMQENIDKDHEIMMLKHELSIIQQSIKKDK